MSPISGWIEVINSFSSAFTAPTRQTFQKVVTGWVLCTARRTVCGMIPFADPAGDRAHDTYHGFFSRAQWVIHELSQALLPLLLRLVPADINPTLILDDTLFHKSGRKVDGAGWWRDAVRSSGERVVTALGLNLAVVALRVIPAWGGEPLALPVMVRLHRKGEAGLIELAEEMLRQIASWAPDRDFDVVADGFFASLGSRLPSRFRLISRLRRDAAIYALPPKRKPGQRGAPRKKGKRLPAPERLSATTRSWNTVTINERGKLKDRLLHARVVLWYHTLGTTPLLLVISRDPEGIEKDDYFFCTDACAAPEEVHEAYANRWPIEDTFRWVKQTLGGQEPQSWADGAPERAAFTAFLVYSMVWTWYLLHGHDATPPRERPWYQHKPHPSFIDALAALRSTIWRHRLSSTFEESPRTRQILDLIVQAAEVA